jgi:hypothetical protein
MDSNLILLCKGEHVKRMPKNVCLLSRVSFCCKNVLYFSRRISVQ